MYTPSKVDRDLSFLTTNYIAHRGYYENNTDHPENSMNAFKRALDNNFGIEFDLQMTKDNKIVIFHDDDMERMTGIKGRICDFTYQQLLKIDLIGSKEKIPLFEDFVKLVNGKVPLIIEIKSCKDTNQKLVDKLVDMLHKYPKKNYGVYSFDPRVVRMVYKKDPSIIRGLLTMYYDNKYSFLTRFVCNNLLSINIAKPDFLSSDTSFRPKKYNKWKKHSPIITWTIRSKEQEKECLSYFDNVIFERYNPKE